ncbi:uncharacterized protein LOC133783414 [Humulus lupulus]|uniref:uncharacterized protein LOC133783414 n=1 Tax=Humulus lupulus TaxID=3486 RepID=UPI002B4153E1|nr:uncharacterized protein LOC133783414 [Humulus lupulus]
MKTTMVRYIWKCFTNHTNYNMFYLGRPIPCLINNDSTYSVYYQPGSGRENYWSSLVSCRRMFNYTFLTADGDGDVLLEWSKSYSASKGGHSLKFSLVTAGFTTGSFVIAVGFLATLYVYQKERQKRENGLRIEKFLEANLCRIELWQT